MSRQLPQLAQNPPEDLMDGGHVMGPFDGGWIGMVNEFRNQLSIFLAGTNELFAMGLLTCTGGNISALAEEPGTFWITPSQLYKGGLSQADLVRIRPDGTVLEGERVPSVEYQMHWRAYEVRPETAGAVHTHAPIATAFGICNQTFPPINTDAVFLRDTVTVPWYMPGSRELADAVGDALKKSKGAILQNHGLMTVGPNLRKAATRAMMLEETAKIVLYTKQFGGTVTVLPDEWIERLNSIADFV
jgi:L-ribulose-5-phosphate 4-epimerase